jgi:hypothetical protein
MKGVKNPMRLRPRKVSKTLTATRNRSGGRELHAQVPDPVRARGDRSGLCACVRAGGLTDEGPDARRPAVGGQREPEQEEVSQLPATLTLEQARDAR